MSTQILRTSWASRGLAHAVATPVMPRDDRRIWRRWLQWIPWVTKNAHDRGLPLARALADAQHTHRQRSIALLLQRCRWDNIERNRLDNPLLTRNEFGRLLDEYIHLRDIGVAGREAHRANAGRKGSQPGAVGH